MDGPEWKTRSIPDGVHLTGEAPLEVELRYVTPNRAGLRLRRWGAGMLAACSLVVVTVIVMLITGAGPFPYPEFVVPATLTVFFGLLFGGVFTLVFSLFIGNGVGRMHLDESTLWLCEMNRWIRVPLSDIRGLALEKRMSPRQIIDFKSMPVVEPAAQAPAALLVRVETGWIRSLTDFRIDQLRWVAERVAKATPVARVDAPRHRPRPVLELGQMTRSAWWAATTFFVLFATAWLLVYLIEIRQAIGSRHWPVVTADVLESDWQSRGRGRSRQFEATFRYRYHIDSQPHESDRYSFAHSADDPAVRQLIASHPAGEQIDVRVDPADPTRATALTGFDPILSFLFFGLPALILPYAGALPFIYPRAGRAHLQQRYFSKPPELAGKGASHSA